MGGPKQEENRIYRVGEVSNLTREGAPAPPGFPFPFPFPLAVEVCVGVVARLGCAVDSSLPTPDPDWEKVVTVGGALTGCGLITSPLPFRCTVSEKRTLLAGLEPLLRGPRVGLGERSLDGMEEPCSDEEVLVLGAEGSRSEERDVAVVRIGRTLEREGCE